MQIKQDLINKNKYSIKAPYSMDAEFVIVHNTYNDAPAKNEISYMKTNNNYTSYHIAVDDKEAIQAIPFNRSTWNAGDGTNGKGNRKGIAVEICYSKSGGSRFDKAEANGAKVVAKLLKDRNWGINKVKKHQDFSGKYCPHRILDRGWDRFIKMVEREMGGTNTVGRGRSYMLQGDTGSDVKKLQQDLNKLGYKISIDGSYGPATKKVVEDFQRKHKLKVDGSAGNEVFSKIKELLKPKPPTSSKKGVYRVVVNSYEDKNNAIKQQEILKKAGFNSFLAYHEE